MLNVLDRQLKLNKKPFSPLSNYDASLVVASGLCHAGQPLHRVMRGRRFTAVSVVGVVENIVWVAKRRRGFSSLSQHILYLRLVIPREAVKIVRISGVNASGEHVLVEHVLGLHVLGVHVFGLLGDSVVESV